MRKHLFFAAAVMFAVSSRADNTATTVEQLTTAITLSDDVDYHITSGTPFSTTGSIDITNTNHAVIILDSLKPSLAVKQLGFITINGAAATNNSNCQIRIWNRGSLILPYTLTGALTVYSEEDCQGDSCSDFDLGNTGGYMQTLTTSQLNNHIKSFRLKRGYMVTFATGYLGLGYSRCFVAQNSDIEMNLPTIMADRVSSYRLFKWQATSKRGLANNTGSSDNAALNTQWCYSFGPGEDTGADRECVPHHIHESWPSITSLGALTYSANMKTNNEPANSSDDSPATVDQVLANWQSLMRTGMRLCSPSQHDGGISWTQAFMDSIDARGWRCDIVDIHCYWNEWSLNNNVAGYYTEYGRPIWISEFLWGASWGGNDYNKGVFSSSDPDNDNLTVMSTVLTKWNALDCLERYAYWNSESMGHLIEDGTLTPLGEYYRDMDTGVGYNPSYEKVPELWRLDAVSDLSADYKPSKGICKLTWTDSNGEFNDTIYVERQDGEKASWKIITEISPSETSTSFNYTDTIMSAGNYAYRIHVKTYNGKDIYSNVIYNVVGGTEGDNEIQYGTISQSTTDDSYSYFVEPFDTIPAIVFGSPTNVNSSLSPCENVVSVTKTGGSYPYFCFRYFPWTLSDVQTFDNGAETSVYIVAKQGEGTIGTLSYEAGYVKNEGKEVSVKNDTVECTFNTPFASAPLVFVTPRYTSTTYPYMWRVWDITDTGFKVILQRQKSLDETYTGFVGQRVAYFAIDKGISNDGNGKRWIAADTTITFKNRVSTYKVTFPETTSNPLFLTQLQSFNHNIAAQMRTRSTGPKDGYTTVRYNTDDTDEDNAISSKNPATEIVGYIIIADDTTYTENIRTATAGSHFAIYPYSRAVGIRDRDANSCALYSAGGQILVSKAVNNGYTTIDISALPKGIYIVRTDTGHSAKFLKQQ